MEDSFQARKPTWVANMIVKPTVGGVWVGGS